MNIEWIGYIAAVCTTFSFLPQVIHVFKTRDTRAISLGMYSFFTFGVMMWLVYALVIKDYPLMLANIVTFTLATPILCYKIKQTFFDKKKSH